jgi:hypothetical protein
LEAVSKLKASAPCLSPSINFSTVYQLTIRPKYNSVANNQAVITIQ